LSQNNIIGHSYCIFKSSSTIFIYNSSRILCVVALNSTSTFDWETTLCFLLLQATKIPHKVQCYFWTRSGFSLLRYTNVSSLALVLATRVEDTYSYKRKAIAHRRNRNGNMWLQILTLKRKNQGGKTHAKILNYSSPPKAKGEWRTHIHES
jgi:hypothetical protein